MPSYAIIYSVSAVFLRHLCRFVAISEKKSENPCFRKSLEFDPLHRLDPGLKEYWCWDFNNRYRVNISQILFTTSAKPKFILLRVVFFSLFPINYSKMAYHQGSDKKQNNLRQWNFLPSINETKQSKLQGHGEFLIIVHFTNSIDDHNQNTSLGDS